jgi:sn-glycerol 3-phosphate transport system permease protein
MTQTEGRIETILARLIGVFVLAFSLYFVASEWDGLVALVGWLWQNLLRTPEAIQALGDYYAALPPAQLLPSLLIGAVVGAVSSGLVLRSLGAIVIGAGVGALGSQLLSRLLQHCTYAAETAPAEAILGIVLTVVSSLLLLLPYWTLAKRGPRKVEPDGAGVFKTPLLPFVFLAPILLSLVLFLYVPSFQTLTLSLSSRRFPLPQERFVCLGNYVSLANDPTYLNSLAVSFLITAMIVVLSLSISLGIAVLASQKLYGASVYRTLLIWPFALSPVVTGAIFLAIFREGGAGLINGVISALTGGTTLNWLRTPELARMAVVAASVWNILGFNILFYIAGLQNVPKDLLEAAQIDGAGRVVRFARITFPLLAPYTFFLLVTNITYAFYGIYGVVDTLTQGGPPLGAAGQDGGATEVLIYKLYEDAFSPGSPAGLAAAQAVLLFLMLVGITLFQFRTLEKRITYAE